MSNKPDERLEFLRERGGQPARSSYLFPQEKYLEQTLAEYIFKPGTPVEISSPLETADSLLERAPIKYGTAQMVCDERIFVTFEASSTNEPTNRKNNEDWYSLDQVNLITKIGVLSYEDER